MNEIQEYAINLLFDILFCNYFLVNQSIEACCPRKEILSLVFSSLAHLNKLKITYFY